MEYIWIDHVNCNEILLTWEKEVNIKTTQNKTRNILGFCTQAHGFLYTPWISKNGFPTPCTPSQAYVRYASMSEWALLYLLH